MSWDAGMDFDSLKAQCPAPDTGYRATDMALDEIHYKGWRIEVLQGQPGWRTLVYYPGSPLHGSVAPDGTDRRAVMEQAETLAGDQPS